MSMPAARLAWATWAFSSLLWLVYVLAWGLGGFEAMPVYAGQPSMDLTVRLAGVVGNAVLATAGALIASRHPRNPIGWMICAAGVQASLGSAVGQYAVLTSQRPVPTTALPWMLWTATWLYAMGNAITALVLLLFPSGRLPDRRWRPVLAVTILLGIVQGIALAVRPGPFPIAPHIGTPLGMEEAAIAAPALISATTRGFVLIYLVAAASLVVRYAQATGALRRQLKWVAVASMAYALALAATYVVPAGWFPALGLLHYLLLTAQAAALGVALVHYRLYDVEVVATRALAYGALALTVTVLYVALAVGAGALLGMQGEPNLWISLLATAVVAVLFEPLRRRLQLVANRLVYGNHSEPYEVLAGFSRRISGVLSAEELLPRMAEAAAQGVTATRARVAVRIGGDRELSVTWPEGAPSAPLEQVVPVVHQGEPVGEIAVSRPSGDPLSPTESRLLADLAAEAGPALHNVRLSFELRDRLSQLARQSEELRASRQRLVAAQDAERRRIERDLHDGAQQQIVALAIQLRLLRTRLEKDPGGAQTIVDTLLGQANDALAELRSLARGIFPPLLEEKGLAAAIQSHVARSHPDASLEVDPALSGVRLAPELETAAYFCVREAIQNSTKHAPGAPVVLRLAMEGTDLVFSVRDEGPGFEASAIAGGTGLQGMADRLAAVGGRVEISSRRGEGTTVEGRIPMEPDQMLTPVAASQADISVSGPNSHLGRKAEAPHSARRAA